MSGLPPGSEPPSPPSGPPPGTPAPPPPRPGDVPPPPPGGFPPPPPVGPGTAGNVAPGWHAPPAGSAERVRHAWQRRHESDYVFDFWSALGWTILTCGIYALYVLYQLVRRSREHNRRRIDLLEGATAFAWEQAQARGLADELRPSFERIAANMTTLRRLAEEFRDPAIWVLLSAVTSGLASYVAYVLLDGDLVDHDRAEGAVEADLSAIFGRLGAPVTPPDPTRLKSRHNWVGRVVATIATCGLYGLFWLYDLMVETNRHFEHNWRWEDDLAQSVQVLARG